MKSKLRSISIFTLFFIPSIVFATPNPPKDLVLKALSSNNVEIKWTDNSDNETGFKIFRDGKLITTTPSDTTSYTDTGLKPSTTYTYTVKATDLTIAEPKLKGVHISEVVPSNKDILPDDDYYDYSDYIELKNYDSKDIDISSYVISNGKTSWVIPSGTTIKANGYLLIWADERNEKKKALHANFKLSSKKATVTLLDRDSKKLDEIKYKKAPSNIALRVVDKKIVYTKPTPKAKNSDLYIEYAQSQKPTFSKEAGFYKGKQTISLSSANNAKIYYTVDGTTPDKNSLLYSSPITIDKTTVVKAVAIESGEFKSDVVTNSYIIDFDTDLPVVSVSTDPKNLFDDYIGIYVVGKNGVVNKECNLNGSPKNYARDWERASFVEYFDENKQRGFKFNTQISITGQCSRENKKKNLAFELEKTDGKKSLNYPLYEHKIDLKDIKDFKLRAGELGYKLQEILSAALASEAGLDIDYQDYKIAHMFMNGEYWGIYHIREKKGKDYLRSNYPDLGKKIDILNWSAKHGDTRAMYAFMNYVESHDLSVDANYQYVVNQMDLHNFIDYLSFMLYSANTDWLNSNFRWWREQKEGAKWRWMFDDMDRTFNDGGDTINGKPINGDSKFDIFKLIQDRDISPLAHLINKLMANASFRADLKARLGELLDSVFTPENVIQTVDRLYNQELPYIDLEKDKWSGAVTSAKLKNNVDIIKEFAKDRANEMRKLMDKYLN